MPAPRNVTQRRFRVRVGCNEGDADRIRRGVIPGEIWESVAGPEDWWIGCHRFPVDIGRQPC